ncbi:uncharacterized protein METZ01_LOCUS91286 [marine metagenome]|uniref:Uncharacterized protein n=1 Tax=marine metagenome TaxID=408172 RepID=A0A381VDN8_9ZZZZ
MKIFDIVQLKVRVVENTTDTILEGAVSFMEENFIPAISILNYSTRSKEARRRSFQALSHQLLVVSCAISNHSFLY